MMYFSCVIYKVTIKLYSSDGMENLLLQIFYFLSLIYEDWI